jgi:DNA-binding protein H-NS
MSKLLELKQQIDQLTAQLEATRAAEFDEQVADIKMRIEAYGIRPEHLFSKEELTGQPATAPKRVRLPPKYQLNGHTWSGKGAPPNWYREAIKAGKVADDLLIAKALAQ